MKGTKKALIGFMLAMILVLALVAGCAQQAGVSSPTAPSAGTPTQVTGSANESGGLLAMEEAIINVCEDASPGVVYIENESVRSTIMGERPSGGSGSGFIIDEEGHILTNDHVVDGAQKLTVYLNDESEWTATVVGADPGNDIALLKIDAPAEQLTPLKLGDSTDLRIGQMAIAIGNPFQLDGTVTVGVISSLGRQMTADNGRSIRSLIQTDAAINPGNSGGPLLNTRGEVVGITNAIESPVYGSVGIGFAVPINTAKAALDDMKAGDTIAHAWLGISGFKVDAALAEELDLGVDYGAYVLSVVKDGPAANAGIHGAGITNLTSREDIVTGGDVIIAVDGQQMNGIEEVAKYTDSKRPGDKVKVTVVRDKVEMEIEVELGKWPENLLSLE